MDPQQTKILAGTQTTILDLEEVDQILKLPIILQHAAQKYLDMTYQSLIQLLNDKVVDRMLGSVFGAFLGDSLGSFCEFKSRQKCYNLAEQTMLMPGGGTFNLLPGQVTDDSEMAMHMLQGLLNYDPKISLDAQTPNLLLSIAKEYVKWVENIPFDIGITTRTALIQLQNCFSKKTSSIEQQFKNLNQAFDQIKKCNEKSLSNGFLMRITPMASFITLLTIKDKQNVKSIPELIKGQVNMTHTNSLCIKSATMYMELIRAMILRTQHGEIQSNYANFHNSFQNTANDNIIGSAIEQAFIVHENGDHKGLLQADGRDAGFFKVAYFYTFYAFREIAINCKTQKQLTSKIYKNIIQFTIAQGGDTDTNACIVGGLVGSILGFQNLPAEYLVKSLNLKLGQSEYRLNERTYDPINGFVNLIKLIKKFK